MYWAVYKMLPCHIISATGFVQKIVVTVKATLLIIFKVLLQVAKFILSRNT